VNRRKTAAILLSRQNLKPSLIDKWVQNLIRAIKFVKQNDLILCSSVGTPNWEIITACASIDQVPLRLFIFGNVNISEIALDFELDESQIEIIKLKPSGLSTDKEKNWKYRDKIIADSSDLLFPISIRPNGHLLELIESNKQVGKELNDKFLTPYEKAKDSFAYSIDKTGLSQNIRQFNGDYVFHWTRASNNPWPDERKIDFYRDILNSDSYPRSALDTLERIVRSNTIIASSKNMPGKTATVSFSALTRIETIDLMKWRARYRQMSFEPYGVGVKREAAFTMGIKEVVYFDSQKKDYNESIPKWLLQSKGEITDWRNEQEFRHFGNVKLDTIDKNDLILVCRYKQEAMKLEKKFQIESKWFCD